MTPAEDHLATLVRLENGVEAGLMSYPGPLNAWVNQAIDEVDHQSLADALADYPLLWWAQVCEYQAS